MLLRWAAVLDLFDYYLATLVLAYVLDAVLGLAFAMWTAGGLQAVRASVDRGWRSATP